MRCSAPPILIAISLARSSTPSSTCSPKASQPRADEAAHLLHRDQVNGRVKGRRGARLAAITSGGAIPENANYAVIAEPDGKTVGTLDEDFAMESLAGDVFLLGTHSWRIKRVESGRVRVDDAHGAAPSIPFWLGEAPGRSRELSAEVAQSANASLASPEPVPAFLIDECGLDEAGAKQAAAYVRAGAAELGALPSQNTVVAERFFDQAGGMQFVLHAPFGSRITRAWGLALRKRFCRTFNFELQAAATDNGLVLSLSDQHSFPLELVFAFLKSATVEDVLRQALLDGAHVRRALALEYHPGACRFCASAAASACPLRSSACGPTICWPPFSRIRWPAPKI